MSDAGPVRLATAADLHALPHNVAAEVIHGEIVKKASPTFSHGHTQGLIVGRLGTRFGGPPGGGEGPGGWWMGTEVEVEYEPHEVYRHDVVGWRRERTPEPPSGFPITLRPDWVCEILSPSNWSNDTVSKFNVLQRVGVPYYWIADVEHGALTAFQLRDGVYSVAAAAKVGDRLKLPPFDDIELDVGALLGLET